MLSLGDNQIGAGGARAISEALKANTTLTCLDIARNEIGESGTQVVSEALKVNTTLTQVGHL
jgi:hypothetical protein